MNGKINNKISKKYMLNKKFSIVNFLKIDCSFFKEKKDSKNSFLSSGSLEFLKWAAIFFMIIDHFALIFLNKEFQFYYLLREVGRISFPLFAFILTYNYIFNTSNKALYIKRLLVFAIISSPFYFFSLEHLGNLYHNIFIDLSFSLLIIFIFEKIYENFKFFQKNNQNKKYQILLFKPLLLFIFSPFILFFIKISQNSSYGFLGIFSIIAFYFTIKNLKTFKLNNRVTNKFYFTASSTFLFLTLYLLNYSPETPYYIFTLSSLFFIFIAIKIDFKLKRTNKWFFYLFYPLHLAVFKIIYLFL